MNFIVMVAIDLVIFWTGWYFGYLGGYNSRKAHEDSKAKARHDRLKEFSQKDGQPHEETCRQWAYSPKQMSVKPNQENQTT